ncbi:dihydroxyacetone kinase family protein [Phycicoccus flavus]|uniref:dihydroxyacetone kinase family protein n=1 Tax=Phycicoccus flavus TaxID=2502783 RepID=UPI000FEC0DE3|nr:dihydroxyacetone kinase family protein [Phycicoccus flavus]NHA68260.1 dihydroxyacetone kinase family protein [Phycicoccus flavus]
MTHLYDDPATFADDMLEGFLDVHSGRVVGVPGGVVRATDTAPGKVAVVVGGGSGHYPAFCGVVGPGLADGAVVGNIFTSPSTEDAYHVGKAALSDAGLLFVTGNYAGDVMNFDLARDRLVREGYETRTLYVTDDVASAPPHDVAKRRGIAGDLVVFKVAGAAAEEGLSLDEVERLARHANDRTRTMGVGLAGCTMPGAHEPLFTVEPGTMGVGLGIHGEPGIATEELPRAQVLAAMLVDRVLAEAPEDSTRRVGAILNGLGATKYEELFVVWRTAARLLRERGWTIVEPEVGELVTSLDMAGISLTLVFLDDELEPRWTAAADTPAYRKGPARPVVGPRRGTVSAQDLAPEIPASSAGSRDVAVVATRVLDRMREALVEAEGDLGRLDSVAGDGDHGRGMVKGVTAACAAAHSAVDRGAGVSTLLALAGRAWAAQAGGTSGVLWGAALEAGGSVLGDDRTVDGRVLAQAVRAGVDRLRELGGADVGDKTMLDALVPLADAFEDGLAGQRRALDAWRDACTRADEAARATAGLRPQVGRARPLAERSVGTPDPGAVSLVLCARTLTHAVADDSAAGR